jgi:hypothetical protein
MSSVSGPVRDLLLLGAALDLALKIGRVRGSEAAFVNNKSAIA